MGYNAECPLCRLWHDGEMTTKLHYEDELLIVVDCVTCKIPMFVIKRHTTEVSDEERQRIFDVRDKLWFGSELRCELRNIKDHYHCHVILS